MWLQRTVMALDYGYSLVKYNGSSYDIPRTEKLLWLT